MSVKRHIKEAVLIFFHKEERQLPIAVATYRRTTANTNPKNVPNALIKQYAMIISETLRVKGTTFKNACPAKTMGIDMYG